MHFDQFQGLKNALNVQAVLKRISANLDSQAPLKVALWGQVPVEWGQEGEWWATSYGPTTAQKRIRVGSIMWKDAWEKATGLPWEKSCAYQMIRRWAGARPVFELGSAPTTAEAMKPIDLRDEKLEDREGNPIEPKFWKPGMPVRDESREPDPPSVEVKVTGPEAIVGADPAKPRGDRTVTYMVRSAKTSRPCPKCGIDTSKPGHKACRGQHSAPTMVERMAMESMDIVFGGGPGWGLTPEQYHETRDAIVERLRVILMS